MPSILEMGQERILAALDDETCTGVCLVVASRKLNRLALIAWAIDEVAQVPNADPDDIFRAMYIGNHPQLVEGIQLRLWSIRGRKRVGQLKEQKFQLSGAIPPLRPMNYASVEAACRMAEKVEANSLELLVIDERERREMDRLGPFIARTNPLFTLVITSFEPAADSPWARFGPPLILRGEAQTPPQPRPEPTSES